MEKRQLSLHAIIMFQLVSAITSILARHGVNLCSPWYQIRSAVGLLGRQEPILGGYGGIASKNDSGSCQLAATEMQSTQWWAGCKAWAWTNRLRKLLACVSLLTLRFSEASMLSRSALWSCTRRVCVVYWSTIKNVTYDAEVTRVVLREDSLFEKLLVGSSSAGVNKWLNTESVLLCNIYFNLMIFDIFTSVFMMYF